MIYVGRTRFLKSDVKSRVYLTKPVTEKSSITLLWYPVYLPDLHDSDHRPTGQKKNCSDAEPTNGTCSSYVKCGTRLSKVLRLQKMTFKKMTLK
jgi:hypothetical protein